MKPTRNNPRILVAFCNIRGNVKGKWVEGEKLEPSTRNPRNTYFSLLKKKHGITAESSGLPNGSAGAKPSQSAQPFEFALNSIAPISSSETRHYQA
jgi:hypothetical protein